MGMRSTNGRLTEPWTVCRPPGGQSADREHVSNLHSSGSSSLRAFLGRTSAGRLDQNLDDYVARRPRGTAVLVLEPRPAAERVDPHHLPRAGRDAALRSRNRRLLTDHMQRGVLDHMTTGRAMSSGSRPREGHWRIDATSTSAQPPPQARQRRRSCGRGR